MNIPIPQELQHKKLRNGYLLAGVAYALYAQGMSIGWSALIVAPMAVAILAQGIADVGKEAEKVRSEDGGGKAVG